MRERAWNSRLMTLMTPTVSESTPGAKITILCSQVSLKKKKTITWNITIASYGKRNVSSALVLILACSKAQELFEGNRREKETTFQKWQLRQLWQNFLQIFTPKMKPVCIEMPIFISNSFTCTWLHFFLDNQKLCDEIIIEKCWWQPRVCSDHGYDIQS